MSCVPCPTLKLLLLPLSFCCVCNCKTIFNSRPDKFWFSVTINGHLKTIIWPWSCCSLATSGEKMCGSVKQRAGVRAFSDKQLRCVLVMDFTGNATYSCINSGCSARATLASRIDPQLPQGNRDQYPCRSLYCLYVVRQVLMPVNAQRMFRQKAANKAKRFTYPKSLESEVVLPLFNQFHCFITFVLVDVRAVH